MRIYFSGSGGSENIPEVLISELGPHVMLTFLDLYQGRNGAKERLKTHFSQKRKAKKHENKS